jgi:hypothetical protein
MASVLSRNGFRNPLNYYRNIEQNWELLAPWEGAVMHQPALFIAGAEDHVIRGPTGKTQLDALSTTVPGLKQKVLLEGAGHYIQQERPTQVTTALINFLRSVAYGCTGGTPAAASSRRPNGTCCWTMVGDSEFNLCGRPCPPATVGGSVAIDGLWPATTGQTARPRRFPVTGRSDPTENVSKRAVSVTAESSIAARSPGSACHCAANP